MNHDLLQILETSGPRLLAMMTRLTLREDVAEDLMQELFIRLNEADGFAGAEDPVAYAYRTAANLAFDWRRARKNTLSLDMRDITDIKFSEPATEDPPPLKRLIDAEQLQEILDALTLLPEVIRNAFVMRHIQQDSYELIAARLEKTPHQVRALCQKAILRLRELMNGKRQLSNEMGDSNVTD